MKYIRRCAWAVCLSVGLTYAGIYWHMKEFWIILIPAAFLVEWSQHKDKSVFCDGRCVDDPENYGAIACADCKGKIKG